MTEGNCTAFQGIPCREPPTHKWCLCTFGNINNQKFCIVSFYSFGQRLFQTKDLFPDVH